MPADFKGELDKNRSTLAFFRTPIRPNAYAVVFRLGERGERRGQERRG